MELAYRIYVDSGYVLSCMTTLAPVCPLIGPFAFLYFVLLAPMVRWLVVFAYRPRFDSGGDKWPKLHHIVITSLLLGQVSHKFALSNSRESIFFPFWLAGSNRSNPQSELFLTCFYLSFCWIRCSRCSLFC